MKEKFNAYSYLFNQVPYISKGDITKAFNEWVESDEYKRETRSFRPAHMNNDINESYENTLARNGEQ